MDMGIITMERRSRGPIVRRRKVRASDGPCASLWPVGSGRRQCGGLHPVRVQFLQAANDAGLAIVQRVQRFPRGAVRRNVRLQFPCPLANGRSSCGVAAKDPLYIAKSNRS